MSEQPAQTQYDPRRPCDEQEVAYGYRLLLGREPDADTRLAFVGRQSVIDFVRGLADSSEHRSLIASGRKTRPCSREDVTYIYRLCLHRDPESEQLYETHVERTDATVLMSDTWKGGSCQKIIAGFASPGSAERPDSKASALQPHMKPSEVSYLAAFLGRTGSYVEFGAGGSTVLACQLVSGRVIAVDSSREWLDKVARACAELADRPQPLLVHVDIGPTGAWGAPIDEGGRDRWPRYSSAVWECPGATLADLYLIDGRFRVACALEALLRCRSDAILLVHDYAPRPQYRIIEEFARPVIACETLAAFVRRDAFDRRGARRALQHARYQPA